MHHREIGNIYKTTFRDLCIEILLTLKLLIIYAIPSSLTEATTSNRLKKKTVKINKL